MQCMCQQNNISPLSGEEFGQIWSRTHAPEMAHSHVAARNLSSDMVNHGYTQIMYYMCNYLRNEAYL